MSNHTEDQIPSSLTPEEKKERQAEADEAARLDEALNSLVTIHRSAMTGMMNILGDPQTVLEWLEAMREDLDKNIENVKRIQVGDVENNSSYTKAGPKGEGPKVESQQHPSFSEDAVNKGVESLAEGDIAKGIPVSATSTKTLN